MSTCSLNELNSSPSKSTEMRRELSTTNFQSTNKSVRTDKASKIAEEGAHVLSASNETASNQTVHSLIKSSNQELALNPTSVLEPLNVKTSATSSVQSEKGSYFS